MEVMDFNFDANSILTGDEAEKLFEDNENQQPENQETEQEQEEQPAEEEDVNQPSEEVGKEDDDENGEDTVQNEDGGTSPYSSIAAALKKEGIFSDFDDETIANVQTAEDLAELFERRADSVVDAKTKRVSDALDNGVPKDTVKAYEQTLAYLNSIDDDAISSEGEDGENLRKQIIYNDLVNRGYSREKALRELEKSFKTGDDVEDAKDALEALRKYYRDEYDKIQKEARDRAEADRKTQKEQADKFKKMVLEDEVSLGDTKLDKKTCQKVFDAVIKPVHKDPDTGRLLTAVQKFQQENPLEFLKQIGIWFVLTDGGKNLSGLVQKRVQAEKNKAVKELARKINTSSLNADGSLKFVGGSGNSDPLLDDGWQVGWN